MLVAAAIIVLAGIVIYLKREESTYKMLYPELVSAASEEFSVPEELIFAIIRSESGFEADATSPAGARGLMQLMPATFEEIAWRLKEDADLSKMNDPYVSIRYGTFYISYLIRYFGNENTAVAAYNAGMGKVRSWLADSRYSDDGVTLKNIPYKETSDYVDKVCKARNKYQKIIGGNR